MSRIPYFKVDSFYSYIITSNSEARMMTGIKLGQCALKEDRKVEIKTNHCIPEKDA